MSYMTELEGDELHDDDIENLGTERKMDHYCAKHNKQN